MQASKSKKLKSMSVDEIMKKLRHLISIIGKTEWNKHIRSASHNSDCVYVCVCNSDCVCVCNSACVYVCM